MSWRFDRRRPAAACVAPLSIVLLGFFLRVHRIGEQRVWWDEGWSVWAARFPAIEILRQTGHDVHPPLYFEALHVWRLLSGDSEVGLRLLSALLGTLTVALTYTLGRRMARGTLSSGGATAVGLLAALFLATSRLAIAWSQEIRMYALASLFATLAVWAARRVWAWQAGNRQIGGRRPEDAGRWRDAAIYVGVTAAGLYTLYLFAPVWAAINIAWLWVWRESSDRRRAFLGWAGLQAAILILFLPWLWVAAGGFLDTAAATPISLLDFLHIYWTTLTVGIPVDVAQFNRLTLPALGIFLTAVAALIVRVTTPVVGAFDAGRDREKGTAARDLTLLLTVLLLPAAIVYVVSLPKQNFYNPPFNPRYLVIFTSFYSILLAWGLGTLGEWLGQRPFWRARGAAAGRIVTLGLAAFMLAVSFVGMRPYYPGRALIDDYPSLAGTISAYRQPGDAVVLYSDTDWPIFAYHYPESWRGVPHLWTITPETADDFLQPVWGAHDAVWLVTTPYSAAGDPQRHIPAWLGERAAAVREFTYKDMALTLYARTEARAVSADTLTDVRPPHPLDITLPNGGRLTGYEQKAHDFKSGDVIHLFLYRAPGEEVTLEIGLIDGDGSVWGTQAVVWPGNVVRRQVDLIVPPEAPSGDYRFVVAGDLAAPFGRVTLTQKQAAFLTLDDVDGGHLIIPNHTDALFASNIRLLGYSLETAAVRPGETMNLTLFWSSDGGLSQQYKVFTHLLGDVYNADSGNFLWGQVDNEPSAGARPTTTWRAAEIIVDEYAIPVAGNAPPGAYRIEVGLYDAISGERLPVIGPDGLPAADHVILTIVEVE